MTFALELRRLHLMRDEDNTAALRQVARENTRLLQVGAIDEAVADDEDPVVEDDRAALLSLCDMDHTELQIYQKMMEVYDKARSHFLFEIVELQVKRYLNAERLKAEAEDPPRALTYLEYTELFLQRTQNSELTQDLLSYILKPREEGCPIYLWAAERRTNLGEQSPHYEWADYVRPCLACLHSGFYYTRGKANFASPLSRRPSCLR
jgi:hypothetical protein